MSRDLKSAITYYSKLIDLKVKFYGEHHETLANPLKNLGNVFQLDNQLPEAQIAYQTCEGVLQHNLQNDRNDKEYKVKAWLKVLKEAVYY